MRVNQQRIERELTGEPEPLTTSEERVLALVAEGLTNQAIAQRLGRTHQGIESAISRIYQKLELSPPPPGRDRRVTAALAWRASWQVNARA